MADDAKPTPRKRAPRKRTTATAEAETPPVETAADDAVESTEEGAGNTLMTTESTEVTEFVNTVIADLSVEDRNKLTLGTLVISYPERDVELLVDGATAERVLAVFSGRERRARVEDRIMLRHTNMSNMWATFEVDRALAMSWIPGMPTPATRRMTIDPPLADGTSK